MEKHIAKLTLGVIVLVGLMLGSKVYGATYGKFEYNAQSDGTVVVTKYNGTEKNVTIPDTIEGKWVKTVCTESFVDNSYIEKVTLPTNLLKLETEAFKNCPNLTTVVFPAGIKMIDAPFYKKCKLLKNYTIPANLTELSYGGYVYAYRELAKVTTTGIFDYDYANEVFGLLNEERAKVGLPALKLDQELCRAANQRAAEIGVYYSHTRPNGITFASASTTTARLMGENIAAGYSSPLYVMRAWMNSPGHKANILKEDFKTVGVASYTTNGTTFWVQFFSTNDLKSNSTYTGIKTNVTTEVEASVNESRFIGVQVDGLESEMSLAPGETIKPTKVWMINAGYQVASNTIKANQLTWTSSNTSIVTVDENGTIKAIKTGEATVTAKIGEFEETYTVTVKAPLVSISVPKTMELATKRSAKIDVGLNPVNTTDDTTVTWTIADPTIVDITEDNMVVGLKAGTTTITAQVGNCIAVCTVTVVEAVDTVRFDDKKTTAVLGGRTKVLGIYFDPANLTDDESTLTWESSNEEVATVKNGEVTPISEGKVVITVITQNGVCAYCEVDVVNTEIGDVSMDGVISVEDAAMILDMYKGVIDVTPELLAAGDINNDGVLSVEDAAMILDKYKGLL